MSATPNPLNSLLESRMQNKVAAHRALLWANCPASFRDGPKDQTRNLEIPGSLVSLAPRNDGARVNAPGSALDVGVPGLFDQLDDVVGHRDVIELFGHLAALGEGPFEELYGLARGRLV